MDMSIIKYSIIIIIIIAIYSLIQFYTDGSINWFMIFIFILLGILGYFVDKKRGES